MTSFVEEARNSRVVALYPRDFPDRVLVSPQTWFVDFFAPWCPPCRRMLPQYRRASLLSADVRFGSVDCEAFGDLCRQFNIGSYPTATLYNGSDATPHIFTGDIFNAEAFVTFVNRVRYPAVFPLTVDLFEKELISNKDQLWVRRVNVGEETAEGEDGGDFWSKL